MNSWIIIEYLINVVDVFLIFYFVQVLLNEDKISINKIMIVIIVQAFINTVINHTLEVASLIGLILMILSTGIVFLLIIKEELFKMYLLIILGLIINFLVEMIVINILISIPSISPEEIITSTSNRILAVILAKSLYFTIIRYGISKLKIRNLFNNINVYQLYYLFIPNLIVISLAFWFYKYVHAFEIPFNTYIAIITGTIVLLSLGLFQITNKIIEHTKNEIEWNEKEEQYRKQAFYIDNIKDLLETFKAQRHDFNHHLGCIYGLMKLDNYDEMGSYIENLTEQISEFNEIVSTKNPILTSLLNIKMAKAKNDNIPVKLSLNIIDDIKIESVDLSSIIGNLLDNSIEACNKLSQNERYIDIEILTKTENLIIKITNGIRGKELDIGKDGYNKYTSKEDKENHGYGLLNIKKIVEKYNGLIKIEENEKYFKVNIALPNRR